ncbi:MAG: Tad domain-containing protein [Bdellovibrio sp.]|nr:Tad domain-containing protein [Bdellovibrio sp.]
MNISKAPSMVFHNDRGNITIAFLFLMTLLYGAVQFSLEMGRMTDQKMKLQQTADVVASSMAGDMSFALNSIALNNLAIGASLHMAASAQFVGRHRTLINALLYDQDDLGKSDKEIFLQDNQKHFEDVARLASVYTLAAAHLTTLNGQLADAWIQASYQRALELVGLNLPGGLGLPYQNDKVMGATVISIPHLTKSTSKGAMCQTIQASQSMVGRNDFVTWLKGPLQSLGLDFGGLDDLVELQKATTMVFNQLKTSVNAKLSTASFNEEYTQKCTGHSIQKENQKWCQTYSYWADPNLALETPMFAECGLNQGGKLADQLEYFANLEPIDRNVNVEGASTMKKKSNKVTFCHVNGNGNLLNTITTDDSGYFSGHIPNHRDDYLGPCKTAVKLDEEFAIGFIYPQIDTDEAVIDFTKSLGVGVVVGSPNAYQSELPKTCPEGWSDSFTNKCHFTLQASDSLLAESPRKELWQRMLWSASEAVAYFSPGLDDPQIGVPQNPNDLSAYKASFFWPAWKSRNVISSRELEVIEYMKERL